MTAEDKLIKDILKTAEEKGLAFVRDDWNGDEEYDPVIDNEAAIRWLRQLLKVIFKR